MRDYENRVLGTITRERIRRLHRCRECFSPWLLPLLFRWDDGGVIALRLINRNLRFAFLENDMLCEILDLLVGHFGEDEVYKIARKTERGSSSGYMAMLFAADKWWLRPFSLAAGYSFLMPYLLEMSVTLLGYAAGKAAELKPPNAMLYTRNPLMPLVASGQIAGTVEALEDRPVEVNWREGPDTTTYTLEF